MRGLKLEPVQVTKRQRFSTTLIAAIVIICLLTGSVAGYSISTLANFKNLSDLQNQVSTLEQRVSALQSATTGADQSDSIIEGSNASLSLIYAEVKDSVVIVRGL